MELIHNAVTTEVSACMLFLCVEFLKKTVANSTHYKLNSSTEQHSMTLPFQEWWDRLGVTGCHGNLEQCEGVM